MPSRRSSGGFARRASPDDDTQPFTTDSLSDPGETSDRSDGAEIRVNAMDDGERAAVENDFRVSGDIPPPSHIDFEDGKPVGGQDPYLGTTFDKRYKIEQVIGEGGMGFVYLARHKVIDKKVAIKVLRSDMARDRENLDRFLQEARAASSIGNPHIVDISDFGDLPDGSTYFVMEYLDGGSLSHLIDAEKPLPAGRICGIGAQMTDGLAAAHAQGIVHRDLKPDNILLITRGNDSDFVKILDFGIAKVMSSAENKLTMAGAVFGTPHYMSPEQAAGTPVDHRTDIYSLGVILYEMASGTLPFNADNFMAILSQQMYQAPTPIREIVAGCSPGLEAVILKCLSKKPEARYQSMEELGEELRRVKSGEVPSAVGEMMSRAEGFDVPPEYFRRAPSTLPAPALRGRAALLYAASALAIVIGVLAVVFALQVTAPTPTPAPTTSVAATPAPTPAEPPPQPTASQAKTAEPPPAPKVVSVALAATPETAEAFIDGKPLKLPTPIDVEEGKTVTLEVRAPGYDPQTVTLDGKERSKFVRLNRKNAPGTAKTAIPGIVDPFDPKRRGQ